MRAIGIRQATGDKVGYIKCRTLDPRATERGETSNDWYLVRLDEGFDYNSRVNTHVLVRSRWQGRTIKDDGTSVFVLLIPKMDMVSEAEIRIEEFEHVVWGKTHLCENT